LAGSGVKDCPDLRVDTEVETETSTESGRYGLEAIQRKINAKETPGNDTESQNVMTEERGRGEA
jgi:hypothetical protein